MKRSSILISLIVAAMALVVLGGQRAAAQSAGFDNKDLRGDYAFVTADPVCGVADPTGEVCPTRVCRYSGTMSFDGAGTVSIVGVLGCTGEVPHATLDSSAYSVGADGGFRITQSAAGDLRGSILEARKVLLFTLALGPDVSDTLFRGVARAKN